MMKIGLRAGIWAREVSLEIRFDEIESRKR